MIHRAHGDPHDDEARACPSSSLSIRSFLALVQKARATKAKMFEGPDIRAIGYALWGILAALLTAAATFAIAWLLIQGVLIVTELFRRWIR